MRSISRNYETETDMVAEEGAELDLKSMDLDNLCAAYKDPHHTKMRNQIFEAMYERGRIMGRETFRHLARIPSEPDALDIALGKTMLAMKQRLDADMHPSPARLPVNDYSRFFYTILRNDLVSLRRQEKRRNRHHRAENIADALHNHHPTVPPNSTYELRELLIRTLQKGFREPEKTGGHRVSRDIIEVYLDYIKGMSHAEIAHKNGCKETAIRKRLERGRAFVRKHAPDFEPGIRSMPSDERLSFRENLDVGTLMNDIAGVVEKEAVELSAAQNAKASDRKKPGRNATSSIENVRIPGEAEMMGSFVNRLGTDTFTGIDVSTGRN